MTNHNPGESFAYAIGMYLLELVVQISYIYVHLMVAHLRQDVLTIYKWHVKNHFHVQEEYIYIYAAFTATTLVLSVCRRRTLPLQNEQRCQMVIAPAW
jgi:hypothetical protein